MTNASRMVEAAYSEGIAASDIFIDPLIFPISVDDAFGSHALDAIAELRRRFGPDIHITGGMSNVSFGIPARKLINEAFLKLAIDAGADSGVIDPVSTDLDLVRSLDIDSGVHALARDAILGAGPGCRLFLKAYRAGDFAEHGLMPPSRRRGLMAWVKVLSWRGIPTSVKARDEAGHRASRSMPDWFGKEVDRVAMKEGLTGEDAYLDQLAWSEEAEEPGDAEAAAESVVARLAAEWGHPVPGSLMARPRAPRVGTTVNLRQVGPAHEGLGQGIADDLRRAILDGSIPADSQPRRSRSRRPLRRQPGPGARRLPRPRSPGARHRAAATRDGRLDRFSLHDIQEVYEVREGLEIVAVRLGSERAIDADLEPLEERLDALEAAWARGAAYPESLALDLDFHRAVVSIPGNQRLIASYEQMLVQTQLNAITCGGAQPASPTEHETRCPSRHPARATGTRRGQERGRGHRPLRLRP